MFRYNRRIAVILACALLMTAVPFTASAASSGAPGKTAITSIKATTASADKEGTITLKWKKVKDATGYQVYARAYSDKKWKMVGKSGRFITAMKCRATGGKYFFKVRAIRKSGGKVKKGAFSKKKDVFVKNRQTLENYIAGNADLQKKIESVAKDKNVKTAVRKNDLVLTADLSKIGGITEEQARNESTLAMLRNEMSKYRSKLGGVAREIQNATGIKGVRVITNYCWGDEVLVSVTFTASDAKA